jgi:hypothetical protein
MKREEKIARVTYLRDAAIAIVRREGKWQKMIVGKKPMFVMGANCGSFQSCTPHRFRNFWSPTFPSDLPQTQKNTPRVR